MLIPSATPSCPSIHDLCGPDRSRALPCPGPRCLQPCVRGWFYHGLCTPPPAKPPPTAALTPALTPAPAVPMAVPIANEMINSDAQTSVPPATFAKSSSDSSAILEGLGGMEKCKVLLPSSCA